MASASHLLQRTCRRSSKPLHATMPPILVANIYASSPRSLFGEILTGALIPLPFLLASLAYPPETSHIASKRVFFGPRKPYREPGLDVVPVVPLAANTAGTSHTALIQACTLSAAALLLVGILARIQSSETLDRRKGASVKGNATTSLFRIRNIPKVLSRVLGVGLPYYAATHLGGIRTAFILLLAISSGLTGWASSSNGNNTFDGIVTAIRRRKTTCAVMLLCGTSDLVGLTVNSTRTNMFLGYLALFMSAFAVPLPAAKLGRPSSATDTPTSSQASPAASRTGSATASPLISSTDEANLTLSAGVVLTIVTITASLLLSTAPGLSIIAIVCSTASLASLSALIFFAQPLYLQSDNKLGVAAGLALTALFGCFYISDSWTIPFVYEALCILAYMAALFDGSASSYSRSELHKKEHHHTHNHSPIKHSILTAYILTFCIPGSVLDTIMRERDSRRIAYFGW
jgi:zinc transporter 5/7